MSDSRWQHVAEIFDQAARLAGEARSAFVAEACAQDESLRREVESLLAHDTAAGSGFLRLPSGLKPLEAGQHVSHYEIQEKLGEGGMGSVYRANDSQLRRPVALKVLPPEFAADPERRQRLLREARTASALSHPNIVSVHEVGSDGGVDFIAMEFVEGKPLDRVIPPTGLPLAEALDYAVQILSGLAKAHAAGVIHRDLKPGNVMLTPDGLVKFLDFGLARRVRLDGEQQSTLTFEGEIAGTPAYMSPEQAEGKDLDQRTDIWSFGVLLYLMLSGCLPFAAGSALDTLYSVLHAEPRPLDAVDGGAAPPAPQLLHIVGRALMKDRNARYASAVEVTRDLARYRDSLKLEESSARSPRALLRSLRRPRIAASAALFAILLCAAGAWLVQRQNRIKWAREQAIPEIDRLVLSLEVGAANLSKAYRLATEAEKYIPGDPVLSELLAKCSGRLNVRTEPAGAAVFVKDVAAPSQGWQYLGTSPLENIRMPFGTFWWKLEEAGYETVMAAVPTFRIDPGKRQRVIPGGFFRVLQSKGKIPPGMVHVPATKTDLGQLSDFFLDRYEVTNRQYKEFVEHGGYRDRRYWKEAFVEEGNVLSWEEAMARFVDQTGRPGPSTWQAGDCAAGQANYPVSGVSWYEAAAYAVYAGRNLPTATHWGAGAGQFTGLFFALNSNFKGQGPGPVGSFPSMTEYGAYDMGGNVREWCWNAIGSGKVVRGGAWNDEAYMNTSTSQAPAFDRSPRNGFRCALYPDPGKIPDKAFGSIEVVTFDPANRRPVSDTVYRIYGEQFAYDRFDLNTRVEWRDGSSAAWVQEKVTVDAAYGGERLPVYVFLPKSSSPPFQTVIYFPGSGAAAMTSSTKLESYWEFEERLAFLVKNGRAVIYPVYKGTFERRQDFPVSTSGVPTRQYSEYLKQLVKDFKRCVDYLETRPDIDTNRMAYLGASWGGRLLPVMLAADQRIKAGIAVSGGIRGNQRPEANEFNYVTHVKVPVLMLNGKYDMAHTLEGTARPMFELLGTPREHKRLVVYDTDHFVPYTELVKESLAFLDRYLGPVK